MIGVKYVDIRPAGFGVKVADRRIGALLGGEMRLDDAGAELRFAPGAELRCLLEDRGPIGTGESRASGEEKRGEEERS